MAQLAGGGWGYELEIDGDAAAAKQLLQLDVRLIESIPSVGVG